MTLRGAGARITVGDIDTGGFSVGVLTSVGWNIIVVIKNFIESYALNYAFITFVFCFQDRLRLRKRCFSVRFRIL